MDFYTISALTLLIGYHIILITITKINPQNSFQGRTGILRKQWVAHVYNNKKDMVVIQTVRNWLLSTIHFASASLMFALGIIGYVMKDDVTNLNLHLMREVFFDPNATTLYPDATFSFKLLIISFVFFMNFTNFLISNRGFIHLGLTSTVYAEENTKELVSVDWLSKLMNTAQLHFTLGVRGFYFAIPLSLWLISSKFFFGGAVCLIFILAYVDLWSCRKA